MLTLDEKLNRLREAAGERRIRIMIIGLGSVGNYLLDYLMSLGDEGIEICTAGRSRERMQSDVNIVRVASMIRGQNRSRISVMGGVDLDNVPTITAAFETYRPDIIVNSSRAYVGLKYGSISWNSIRAYGIWTPLAVKYTRNIMEAYGKAGSDAVVINTSYSDVVIPWLRSAGRAYPDFGSGNINHLIPRFQFAIAAKMGIDDYWNIDVTLAVSHFHDVVISREGHTEGADMLIDIRYHGRKVDLNVTEMIAECSIPMPVDAKRNKMNASSNYEIIKAVLSVVRDRKKVKLHCPGAFGETGGYPVILDGSQDSVKAVICEDYFDMGTMRKKNQESIYLDGIENIAGGVLTYTDELLDKVRKAFGIGLVKNVAFDEIDRVAAFIVKEIIEKNI